jgi:hypothetical protein
MTWPFLYYAGDRLSGAELMAARLDGDVVEIGDAFMPADAVETRELRAGSLRPMAGSHLAITHESAAWVHGVLNEPPTRHSLQRCVAARRHRLLDGGVRYRDLCLPERDGIRIAGVVVTTPVRTLVDVLRDRVLRDDDDPAVVEALIRWRPQLVPAAIGWLDDAGPVPFKRASLSYLRRSLVTTR